MIALEDDFCDILTKAMRGQGIAITALAMLLQEAPEQVAQWCKGPALPSDPIITHIATFLALDPECLLDSAHQCWHPQLTMPAAVTQYQQIPHVSNGYIIQEADEIAIVDPAGDAVTALATIAKRGESLRYILVTHRHDDHCDAALRILNVYPRARLLIHPTELEAVPQLSDYATTVSHEDVFSFAASTITVHVIPGHVDGLTCYQIGENLFVGDAIFAGSIGRNFGPQTSYAQQRAYLRNRLFSLPPHLLLFPGHGPITSIGLEREHNPFVRARHQ